MDLISHFVHSIAFNQPQTLPRNWPSPHVLLNGEEVLSLKAKGQARSARVYGKQRSPGTSRLLLGDRQARGSLAADCFSSERLTPAPEGGHLRCPRSLLPKEKGKAHRPAGSRMGPAEPRISGPPPWEDRRASREQALGRRPVLGCCRPAGSQEAVLPRTGVLWACGPQARGRLLGCRRTTPKSEGPALGSPACGFPRFLR